MSVPTPRRRRPVPRRDRRNRCPFLETLEPRMLLATIQGTLFEDLNGDGVRAPEDPALQMPGITVFLDQNQNGVLDTGEDSTTTDASGSYEFTELPVGDYTVAQLVPDNWLQTTLTPAAPSRLGSVLDELDVAHLGDWLGGIAWDATANLLYVRVRATGILPIDPSTGQLPPNATGFSLPTDNMLDLTLDNLTGDFWGVDPVADMIVHFRRPAGETTQPVVVEQFAIQIPGVDNPYSAGITWDNTDGTLWVLERTTEKLYHFDPGSGALIQGTIDAPGSGGLLCGLTFDGQHFWTNRYGDREAWNETYEFNHLGQLTRQFASPTVDTYRAVGVAFGGTDVDGKQVLWVAQYFSGRLFKVDVSRIGGFGVSLSSEAETVTCDFGNFQLTTVSGTVFHDVDQDGTRDDTEPGLAGWQVYLEGSASQQMEIWKSLVVTNSDGNYTIIAPSRGEYSIVLAQRQPGWIATTGNQVDIELNSESGQSVQVYFGQRLTGLAPFGDEITVSIGTDAFRDDLAGQLIASDAMGNFAVAWEAQDPMAPNWLGLYVRLFDATGNPRSGNILVGEESFGDQRFGNRFQPSIAMADNGDFVIVWRSLVIEGAVYARQYSADGTPRPNGQFVAYYDKSRNVALPVNVAMDGEGNFALLVYAKYDVYGSFPRNFAWLLQRFDSSGAAIGRPISLGTKSGESRNVSMASDGSFVVAGSALDGFVWAQRYDSNGKAIGNQLVAGTTSEYSLNIDMSRDGSYFAVSWRESTVDYARVYTSGNWTTPVPFAVEGSRIGIDKAGNCIVTYAVSKYGGNGGSELYATRHAPDGSVVGGAFRVTTTVYGQDGWTKNWIEVTNDDGILAAWYGIVTTPTVFQGVVAQVYRYTANDNHEPVAESDMLATVEDAAATINVLANDCDVDSDRLTVESFSQGSNGVVTNLGGGILQYSPDLNFFGNDNFTYTISDGFGGTDTANVSITITPVNDAPVALNDSATTAPNQSVTINVLGNDFDVDGDTLNVDLSTSPASGSVVNLGGGLLQYTPNSGFAGDDSFTYTISDGHGGTDTAAVSITVQTVSTMHVGDLDGSARWVNKTKWTATVVANVFDGIGAPVANAIVQGTWSNGTTSSATTNSTGQATLLSGNVDKSIGSVTFTVTNITHASFHYAPNANTDPDVPADSNGTVITVVKPAALLAANSTKGSAPAAALTEGAAETAVYQALLLWSQQIVMALPPEVHIQVADIPSGFLGWASGNTITLDVSADGAGWYTGLGTPAAGRVDLLTVVSHEIGHVLGYGHSDVAGDLMYETLGPGTQRLPGSTPVTMAALCDSAIVSSLLLPERRDVPLHDLADPPLLANAVERNAGADGSQWMLPLITADYTAQPQRTSDTVRARIVKTIANEEMELLEDELLDLIAANQQ